MYNIKELYNCLPITYDNKIINIISFEDMDWYLNNCVQDYFEEYLDFKFSKDIKYENLQSALYKIIVGYKLKIEEYGEARLLLKDLNTKEIYGGCTIFERGNNLELAYFIIPKYHNKNIATSMLREVINALAISDIQFNKFVLTVREDNIASLKVAEKLNFKFSHEYSGKYKINKVFKLERREVEH